MLMLREQGFNQNIQQPFQQGITQFGQPQPFQQPQQFQPPQQLAPQFASGQPLPQDLAQLAYLQQGFMPLPPQAGFAQPLPWQGGDQPGHPQQGFAQPAQQGQPRMFQFGYPQPLPQQSVEQPGFLQQAAQGLAQQRMPQPGYGQPLLQQGIGGLMQQPQPEYGLPQPMLQGMARPRQDYEMEQQSRRAEADLRRARRGPKNYTRSDERMRELICEGLIQDWSIDAGDVNVEVQNGRVILEGTVPHRQMRHAIEDVVDRCWGVQDIENHIRVQSGPEAGGGFSAAGQSQENRPAAQSGGGFAGSAALPVSGKAEGKGKSSRDDAHPA